MKTTVKTEQTIEIANGYYKSLGGGYIFLHEDEKTKESKVIRISEGAMIYKSDELMAHEVESFKCDVYQLCTPHEFWNAYMQTMSAFTLEYHEHVSKYKTNDFIAAQADRTGELC